MSGQKIIDGLQDALRDAAERVERMTPSEREEMYRRQRRSFVRAMAGFGSDADEQAYRKAIAHGDEAEIARLESEASARMDAVDAYFDERETS